MCDGDARERVCDEDQFAAARLRELIAAGLNSRDARPVTDPDIAEMRDGAFGEVDGRAVNGNEVPP